VEYSRAPGVIPTTQGDYGPVLDELLTAEPVEALGGAA
jgi:hypothetical protein